MLQKTKFLSKLLVSSISFLFHIQITYAIDVSGPITNDTIWEANSIITIIDDVIVKDGVTLTVQKGCRIQFKSSPADLHIQGHIQVEGTSDAPVTFAATSDTSNWGGIYIEGFGMEEKSTFRYAIMKQGGSNYFSLTKISMVRIKDTSPDFHNCNFLNSNSYAMMLENSDCLISDCQFEGNAYDPIWMDVNSSPYITGNIASKNRFDGIRIKEGTLSQNQIWRTSNLPYLVNQDVVIPSGLELTIEPGASIQFEESAADLNVAGTLNAGGTVNQPILFTSKNDVSQNQWGGIYFTGKTADRSKLEYCELRYGGSNYFSLTGDSMIRCDQSSPTLAHCTIAKSNRNGISLLQSNAALTSMRFESNINAAVYMNTTSFPIFTDIEAKDNQFNAIQILPGELKDSGRWDYAEIPYLIADDVILPTSFVLTIDPGAIIQFQQGSSDLISYGTLNTIGNENQPIVFTSLTDSPGNQWGGIYFNSDAANLSRMEYCQLRYGGSNYFSKTGDSMIRCEQSSPLISHCVIAKSNRNGISLLQSNTPLTAVRFESNNNAAAYMDTNSFPIFTDLRANGNQYDAIQILPGSLPPNGRWDYVEIPYLITDDVTLPAGGTLTIDPGTEIQFLQSSADLIVYGTLNAVGNANQPIIFTSLMNLATNNWGGIYFTSDSAGGSTIQFGQIRNGGSRYFSATNESNIRIENCSPSLLNCYIQNSSNDGINLFNSNAVMENCRIEKCKGHAIRMDVNSSPYFHENQVLENGFNTITIRPGVFSKSERWRYSNITYNLEEDVTIPEGVHLTIAAGNGIRFQTSSTDLIVNGSLAAEGTRGNPIRFSPLGEQTNGRYGGIYFGPTTENIQTVLSYCLFEYGGSNYFSKTGASMIYCDGSSPKIAYCTFRNSAWDGLAISQGAPQIRNSEFYNNNRYAVHIYPNSFPDYRSLIAVGNGGNCIHIYGGAEWSGAGVWLNAGLPYWITEDVKIGSTANISIESGNIFQFVNSSSDLSIAGILKCIGTEVEPITFTSNKTNPQPGSWGSLFFAKNSIGDIAFANFEFGGSNYFSDGGESNVFISEAADVSLSYSTFKESFTSGLVVAATEAVVDHCIFSNNRQSGVQVQGNGDVEINGCQLISNGLGISTRGESSRIRFADNLFQKNGKTGSVNIGTAACSKPMNTVMGDLGGLEITASHLVHPGMLYPLIGGYYEINNGDVFIEKSGQLQIHPGTYLALRGWNARLSISGFLGVNGLRGQPVIIAAPPDIYNVTNQTHYPGIVFINEGKGIIKNAMIRNGGGWSRGAVEGADQSNIQVESSLLEYNGRALRATGKSKITALYCQFYKNEIGLEVDGDLGIDAIANLCQIAGNQSGVINRNPVKDVDATFNWWGSAEGPSGSAPGVGDSISEGVQYKPWFSDSSQVPDQPLESREITEINQPLSDEIFANGFKIYRITTEPGKNLLCKLSGVNPGSMYHLYSSFEQQPSPARYDVKTEGPQIHGTHELIIADTKGGTYYFLIFAADLAVEKETYRIGFSYVDEYVVSVNPKESGNNGQTTFHLIGAEFNNSTEVRLRAPGGTLVSPLNIQIPDSGHLYAPMNLKGLSTGLYDILVKWPSKSIELSFENVVKINAGIGPRLEVRLITPQFMWVNRIYPLTIDFKNTGDSDLQAPVLIIRSNPEITMSVSQEGPFNKSPIQVLGIPDEGPPGVLPSGAGGKISIYFIHTIHEPVTFSVSILDRPDLAIEWNSPYYQVYAQTIGTTWGDFQTALGDNATALWQEGVRIYDVNQLFSRMINTILQMKPSEIWGSVIDDQNSHPQAHVTVSLNNMTPQTPSGWIGEVETDENGKFVFPDLSAGNYQVEVLDYPRVVPSEITLGQNEIKTNITLQVPHGGVIEGTVYRIPERTPFEGVTLELHSDNDTNRSTLTDENGHYRFPSLGEGNYRLQAMFSKYAAKRYTNLEILPGRILREVDFLLEPGTVLSGIVYEKDTTVPVSNPRLFADDSQGIRYTALSYSNGTYKFEDLSPGKYTVYCMAKGYQLTKTAGIDVPAGGRDSYNLELGKAVTGKGRVTNHANGNPVPAALVVFSDLTGSTGSLAGTDDNGNFEALYLNSGNYYVWAVASGFAMSRKMVQITESNNERVEISLVRSASISGTVVGKDGKTLIENGSIVIKDTDGSILTSGNIANGTFAFKGLPVGKIQLYVTGSDLTFPVYEYDLQADLNNLQIKAAEGIVRGTILFGEPPQGVGPVLVTAMPTGTDSLIHQQMIVGSNPDGTYEFNGLVPGEYWIVATALDYGWAASRVTLGNSPATADLTLVEKCVVEGQIISANSGEALAGALVQISNSEWQKNYWVLSNSEGKFSAHGLSPGLYEIQVQAKGYPRYKQTDIQVNPGNTPTSLSLAIPNNGIVLTGQILDELSGLPIPTAAIYLYMDGLEAGNVVANKEGIYRTTPLLPGMYKIRVILDSIRMESEMEIMNDPSEQVKNFSVKLTPGIGLPLYQKVNRKIRPQFSIAGVSDIFWDIFYLPSVIIDDLAYLEEFLPADYEDFVTENPEFAREDNANKVINYLRGGYKEWEERALNITAVCRHYAFRVMQELDRSEEAYKRTWESKNRNDATEWIGWGETVSQGFVALGKAAELYLASGKAAAELGGIAISNLDKFQELLNKKNKLDNIRDVMTFGKDIAIIANRIQQLYSQWKLGQVEDWSAFWKTVWWEVRKLAEYKGFKEKLMNQLEDNKELAVVLGPVLRVLDVGIEIYNTYKTYEATQTNNEVNVINTTEHYFQYVKHANRAYAAMLEYDKCEKNWRDYIGKTPPVYQSNQSIAAGQSNVRVVIDPNEKVGPGGIQAEITGTQKLTYTIFFENLPTAKHAAQQVTINDDLSNLFDWKTFELHEATFGDRVISFSAGSKESNQRVIFGDYAVEMDANINAYTGRARWIITMIDPETGKLPTDGEVGFLPPNNPVVGNGEGHVTFSISLIPGLKPGTQIKNRAVIVFDNNEPIETNETFHTINTSAPDRPSAVSPKLGEQSANLTPWLIAVAYANPGGYKHIGSNFQLYDYTFNTLVWEANLTGGIIQVQIPPNILEPNRQYTWRVRYQSENLKWSDWSESAWFGTFNPVIVGDLNGDGKVDFIDLLILSNYWYIEGIGDFNTDNRIDQYDLLLFESAIKF